MRRLTSLFIVFLSALLVGPAMAQQAPPRLVVQDTVDALRGDKYFTTKRTLSPAGDELTRDFAKTLLDNEELGQDAVPDYLAISFSSTDYVGHIFGAASLESEDNLAHLDRVLADLFAHIDDKVGLANTLIVLSADHGQPGVLRR
jgi:predicted AlkP superfamily pyrophosphatase or phosphodiesterase